jgi:HSP20 family protein
VLEYALAGYNSDQLNISLSGDELIVSAEVDNGSNGRRIVRKSFSHSVRVPHDLDATKLQASFVDGILRIEIPEKDEAKPKTFKIK